MKIYSIDRNSWLSVELNVDEENDYSSFSIRSNIDINHCKFYGENTDVYFYNIAEFATEFDKFILDRTVKPTLEGTYDTYLSFESKSNSIVVSLCIGGSTSGEINQAYSIKGGFEISQENLNDVLRFFQKHIDK